MDPTRNPFVPGAGMRPPTMAGRDEAVQMSKVALAQLKRGAFSRPGILYGLRGVGKTVLLNVIESHARDAGCHVISFEATDKVGLEEGLIPELQRVLGRLSASAKAKQLALRATNAVQDLLSRLELAFGEASVKVSAPKQASHAGAIEVHLTNALVAVGEAARAADEPVVIFIDELQYMHLRESGRDLGALIAALHKAGQQNLPIGFFGAGLPQIHGVVTSLKSYAERFFEFSKVGALSADDASRAIRQPITEGEESIADDALAYLVGKTRGYPYFLQEYGRFAWQCAEASPISLQDAEQAHGEATKALDAGFFEARMQRATPKERTYLFAMAGLGGSGPYSSNAVARAMGVKAAAVTPYRDALIKKGIIWSPARGSLEFTVPMFDEYLRRQIPASAPAAQPARRRPPAPKRPRGRRRR